MSLQASFLKDKWRLLKITLQALFLNVKMTYVHISSSLVLNQMTSDHNRSELGIQDHSNEQSSSKLVPKVVPLAMLRTTGVEPTKEKLEKLIIDGKVTLVDDDGKPQKKVNYLGDHDSDDEVESLDNDMACSMASEKVGFGTKSLLEQWKDSYDNGDYDEDPYDDDMYKVSSLCVSSYKEVVLPMPTNIILQGLPSDIYSLVNHHRVARDLWERIQLLMQGTSLTKQERECKLYDAFDKFAHIKGESLHQYYLRFTQINDMNIYNMKLEQFQVNTKFLNSLPP
ncbi:hypothetical protein Tco_1211872 [Tanacetum coccineum]